MPVRIAGIIVLSFFGILIGCNDGLRSGARSPTTFDLGNAGEPKSLDPHLVTGVLEDRILSALFEGLVNLDLATMTPVPGAAESWTISEGGTVYTFTLQREGKWSNGERVLAGDFVYAWRRILTPALAGEYGYMLYPIVNAEAYHTGEIDDFAQVGVQALDERTLQVTLRAPTPYFLPMQVHYTWFPLNQRAVEKHGRMDERDTEWVRPGNLVGNGPFVLSEWSPNERIVVTKNAAYWDADAVSLEEIVYHSIANPTVEERSFRAGELDMTFTAPLTKIPAYQRDHPELIRIDPYLGVEFVRFNTTRAPFNDVNVRRAFAMAIDRETLVAKVLRAGQKPATHFVPTGIGSYTSNYEIPYDPERARRFLELAGYPAGEGFPRVELIYDSGDNQRIYVEALQAMWKTNLGVEVGLANLDTKTWLANMIGLDYQIARSYWIGDYIDPSNFLEMFYAKSGNNRTGFASYEYEDLLRKAGAALNSSERNGLYQQAETLLLSEVAIAPVYFHTRPFLISPRVKGVTANILGRINFKEIDLTGQ